MMTSDELQELRVTYLESIKKFMTESGGLDPRLTVFAEHLKPTDDKNHAIIHIPIPNMYMKSDQGKQFFVSEIVPDIAKKVKESFNPLAVAWVAEAWVREAPKETKIEDINYKDLPITKEILIVTFESDDIKEVETYEIFRQGKQINDQGQLVDCINLVKDQTLSQAEYPEGRFTGLYKKFKVVE